jgi:PhnB protein
LSQTITPYLLYEDCAAALEFLSHAFGFEEVLRSTSPEGRVWHAEMKFGDGSIFMGEPGRDYRNPKHLGANTFSLYVYVDDVETHYERARAAGADIVDEPADQEYGDRRYHARDPEGQEWFFAQRIGDVAPEEWGAEVTEVREEKS